MYRFLPLLLLCLLLSGCGAADFPLECGPGLPSFEASPAVSAGSLSPGSKLEGTKNGPLTAYSLEDCPATGLRAIGQDLLLISATGTASTLTVLDSDTLTVSASAVLDFPLDPRDSSLRTSEDFLSCFDPLRRETVILNPSLEVTSRIPAPQGLQGVPLLSQDQQFLYYCTASAICRWDLDSGLQRRIKEISFPGQCLTGLSLGDSVLICRIPEKTQTRTLLLSAQTGRLLSEQSGEAEFAGEDGRYFASLPAGPDRALVFGSTSGKPRLLLPADPPDACFYFEHLSRAVTVASSPEGQIVSCYDLSSGLRTASLTLDCAQLPLAVEASGESLYILTPGTQSASPVLCRWDIPSDSDALETVSYTFPYHTAQNPDLTGLAQCQALAAGLGEKYGIEIRIWEDAVRLQPWNYDLDPEYQTAVLRRELELLDQRLSRFPSHFLPDMAAQFSSLKLCIVRQISGTAESGDQSTVPQLQFFDGTDAYVVISAGRTSEGALYHGLYLAMETRIFAESSALDQWDTLNPLDFSYFCLAGSDRDPGIYLDGEDRAFTSLSAMNYPKEDRAGILEYAMLPGNQAFFRPWRMQRKLRALCLGIREAFSLEECPEAFLWEQYLDAPLTGGNP